jgi:hypothetical protein
MAKKCRRRQLRLVDRVERLWFEIENMAVTPVPADRRYLDSFLACLGVKEERRPEVMKAARASP